MAKPGTYICTSLAEQLSYWLHSKLLQCCCRRGAASLCCGCMCRVAWPAVMKGWEQWHDVYSADGQLLFAGLRAKVSVFHGQMTRIVPHTTTGQLLLLLQLAHSVGTASSFLCHCTKQKLHHVANHSLSADTKSKDDQYQSRMSTNACLPGVLCKFVRCHKEQPRANRENSMQNLPDQNTAPARQTTKGNHHMHLAYSWPPISHELSRVCMRRLKDSPHAQSERSWCQTCSAECPSRSKRLWRCGYVCRMSDIPLPKKVLYGQVNCRGVVGRSRNLWNDVVLSEFDQYTSPP